MARGSGDRSIEINVTSNIDSFLANLKKIQDAVNKLDLTQTDSKSFDKSFRQIKENFDELKSYIGNNQLRVVDNEKVQQIFKKISEQYNKLTNNIESKKLFDKPIREAAELEKALEKVEKEYKNLDRNAKSLVNNKMSEADKVELKRAKDVIGNYQKKYEALQKYEKAKEAVLQKANDKRYKVDRNEFDFRAAKGGSKLWDTNEGKALKEAEAEVQQYIKSLASAKNPSEAFKNTAEHITKAYTEATAVVANFNKKIENIKIDNLKRVQETLISLGIPEERVQTAQQIELVFEDIKKVSEEIKGTNPLKEMDETLKETGKDAEKAGEKILDAGRACDKLTEKEQQIESMRRRLTAFFGIDNAARLFRRSIQSAVNTIKELDAAMTEMAVVTKLDIGDYWKQLPQYTDRANALGVATKSAYEAATLYYQQGLKTKQVVELSIPTLRMARIAGLDAAEATDRMTNALRGFNMELNETNANRVADVYSKLAAITASNVDEISTAMTKTASIASNAGMAFETTAAFLSQIIETTRESAETAGTALKTVIARFQELKKDPSLIGEVDGEVVDANKIETALRTVGIALRDSAGQFRKLDDVFMELAEKWDTLDTNTQRYIATIAAGSRQQSRFIAMMSNYQHTVELVNAANNAAGASNEQFNKTLESLESKINKLKNAWNEFTMGIANSSFVKGVVDALTTLLNIINKLTKGWDNFSSSILKIGAALLLLRTGRIVVNTLFKTLVKGTPIVKTFTKATKEAETATESLTLAQKILNKIQTIFIGQTYASATANTADTAAALNRAGAYSLLGKKVGALALGGKSLVSVILVTVAAVTALVLIYKQIKYNSIEEQLERAKKATQGAADAAEAAAEAYENLNTALDDLDNKYNSLKELTEGTTEWYKSVQEVNNAVIDLISNYPKLAKFMQAAENGVLTIDVNTKEVQKVVDQYQKTATTAKLLESQFRIEQQGLQDKVDAKTIAKSLGLDVNQTMSLAKAFRSGEITPDENGDYTDAIEKWLDSFMPYMEGSFISVAKTANKLSEELTKLGVSLETSETVKTSQLQAMVTTAYNTVNKQQYTNEQLKQMEAFITTDFMKSEISASTSELTNKLRSSGGAQLRKELTEEYGKTYYGENYKRINGLGFIEYTNEKGRTSWAMPSDETLVKYGAGERASDNTAKILERVPEAIYKLGKQLNNPTAINNWASAKEGKGLTREDINNLEKFSETLAEELYKQNDALQLMYGSAKEFYEALSKDKQFAKDALDAVDAKLLNFGINNLPEYLTLGAKEGLADNLAIVLRESGEGAVQEVSNTINDKITAIGRVSQEDANKFATALNSVTWTSEEQIKGLSDLIKEMGLTSYFTEDEISALENQIDDLAKATNGLNLENLNNKLETFGDIISKVRDNISNNSRTYTTKERNDLIDTESAKYNEFIITGIDEWTYIGNQNTLLEGIYKNTSSILKEMTEDIYDEIKAGEDFEKNFNANKDTIYPILNGKEYLLENLLLGLNSGDLNAGNLGDELIHTLTQQLLGWTDSMFNKAGAGEAVEALKIGYQRMKNLPQNRATAEEYENNQQVLNFSILSKGQSITDAINNPQDVANADKALTGLINANLGYKTASDQVVASLKKQNSALSDNSILTKAHAKDNQDNKASLEKLAQTFNDYTQAISEGKDGYAEYEALREDFVKTYGESVRGLITPELVNSNVKLFQDMMDEDVNIAEEAFKKIQEFINKTLKNDKDYQALPDSIKKDIEELEAKMPIEGTVDISNIMNGIAEIYGYGSQVFEKLKNLIQGAFNITVNTEGTDTVTAKIGSETERFKKNGYKVVDIDPESGLAKLIRYSRGIATSNDEPFKEPTDKGTAKTLENQYDWLYNLTSHIAQKTAEKAREEKKYQQLLKLEGSSMENITKSYEAQEEALRDQAIMQEKMVQSRTSELDWIMAKYADVGEFAKWNGERVVIDWKKIEAVKNSGNEDLMERINDFIGQLEHAEDERNNAIDALLDIDATLQNMREQLTQAYLSMEQRISDAIVYDRQSKIDREQELLDAYSNANSDLIECINKNISKLRQDRENDKAERNISTLEQRRAYLIASGASAKEIKQIDEQLNEAKENYTDSLIDQAINNLEEYNEEAVEQRQRMIDLQQSQLEWDKENGVIARQAYERLINLKTDKWGGLDTSDPNTAATYDLLQKAEGFQSMSMQRGSEWRAGLTNAIHEALLAYQQGAVAEDKNDYEQMMIDRFREKGAVDSTMYYWNGLRNEKIDRLGMDPSLKITNDDLEEYLRNKTGVGIVGDTAKEPTDEGASPSLASGQTSTPQDSAHGVLASLGDKINNDEDVRKLQKGLNDLINDGKLTGIAKLDVDGSYGPLTQAAVKVLQDIIGTRIDGWWGPMTREAFKNSTLSRYAQGGLATSTGLAWLDGTRSKPEVVLDAADSANFIQLRDILRNLLPGITNTNTSRDAYYNFEINVDQIASDYDIEQIAQTVKTIINREGSYRNVNNLSRVR